MFNIWDYLKDFKGKKAVNASNQADLDAYNKMLAGEDIDTVEQKPEQQPTKMADTLVMGANGEVDYPASVKLKQQTTPLSLADKLIGRTVSIDKETVNPKTNEITTERFSDYKPGFFNDFGAGYRENRTTPISLDNFGQKKNFSTRLGEGVGSIARLAESPAGRALIMGGIVGATGGSGLEALAYGGGAGLGNQQNRMKDRLYRDSLLEQMQNSIRNQEGFAKLKPEEQQTLLRNAANRVNSYRGYIGDDTYKQILTGMQLQDNAAYRNALLKTQMNNQLLANQLAQQKLNYEMKQDAIQNAFKGRELSIKEKYYTNKENNNNKYKDDMANLLAIEGQLKNFEELFEEMPGKLKSYTVGKVQEKLGLQDATRAEFESRLNLLFNKISRDLGGERGVLSNQDIERAMKASPTYYDNLEQKKAKMRAIYDLLELAKNKMAYKYNIDAQNYTGNNNIQSTNEGWAF